jgi:hypothetical protein
MRVIKAAYQKKDNRNIVNLRFKTLDQLLDPDDHSPLEQKEVTPDAEDSIINNAYAGSLKMPLNLEIEIPGVPNPESAIKISDAIRNHFCFVLSEHKRDTAIFIRERRISLAFTVLNILIALLYIGYSSLHENWMSSLAGVVIGAVIIIINWATIWDTYEFFIFDGRQKYHRKNLLKKIIEAEIKVVFFSPES